MGLHVRGGVKGMIFILNLEFCTEMVHLEIKKIKLVRMGKY